ncbi:hypothetical protein [Ascidiimonas aurantiaca]|uniref:hypothetical protein n=1 Tax=Ascidiimonas aurantiaca TaxID=1685432 RepID=UPI0030EB1BF3
MKKTLKNLYLKKYIVSKLNEIQGGEEVITTYTRVPVKECLVEITREYRTCQVQTNEVDTAGRPIC